MENSTSIIISVGGLITMIAALLGIGSRIKKEIKEENLQLIRAAVAEHQLSCNKDINDKLDTISHNINELALQVARMNGNA